MKTSNFLIFQLRMLRFLAKFFAIPRKAFFPFIYTIKKSHRAWFHWKRIKLFCPILYTPQCIILFKINDLKWAIFQYLFLSVAAWKKVWPRSQLSHSQCQIFAAFWGVAYFTWFQYVQIHYFLYFIEIFKNAL